MLFDFFKKYTAVYNNTLLFIVVFISYISSCVRHIVIAKHIPVAMYGNYVLTIHIMTIIAAIAPLGCVTASRKFLPVYIENNQHHKARGLLIYSIFIIACVSIVLLIANFIWLAFASGQIKLYLEGTWIFVFFSICSFLYNLLSSGRSAIIGLTLNSILKQLIVALVLWCIIRISPPLDLLTIYIVTAIVSVFIILCLLLLFFIKKTYKLIGKTKIEAKTWAVFGASVLLLAILNICTSTIESLWVKLFIHDPNALGLFSAAIVIANVLYTIPSYLASVFIPHIMSSHQHSLKRLQSTYNRIQLTGQIPCILLLIVIFIFGKDFLSLFGPSYVHAYIPLVIIAAGNLGISFSLGSFSLLKYVGHTGFVNIIAICIFLFEVGGGILLTKFFSINGASLSIAIASWGFVIPCMIYVRYRFKIKPLIII